MHKIMAGKKIRFNPSLMDYMAIAAGIINVVVIGYIVGHWFLQ